LKKGFTTPELIIAIGIIGVIAVMTMPSIYNHFHGAEFETASQKLQLQLTQILESMNADQSLIGHASTADFVNVFKTYLKTVKTCPSSDLTGCFAETFRTEEEEFSLSDVKNSAFMGKKEWKSKVEGIRLNNGISLLIAYNPYCSKKNPTNCASILYDLNSIEKDNIFKGNGHSDLGMYNAAYVGGSSCAFEIDGTCFSMPFAANSYHTWNACNEDMYTSENSEDQAYMQKYGLDYCYPGDDYFAKAAEVCGGIDKMTQISDLITIAEYIYGTSDINEESYQSGLTISVQPSSLGLPAPEFWIWAGAETTYRISAYNRYFASDYTGNTGLNRNNSSGWAICLGD